MTDERLVEVLNNVQGNVVLSGYDEHSVSDCTQAGEKTIVFRS